MKLAEGEPPPLHPHPHSSNILAYAIAIIPQNSASVSILMKNYSSSLCISDWMGRFLNRYLYARK
jgi:hypothetical protein